MFHVWVDPLFGDNARAVAQNPQINGPGLWPLDIHPEMPSSQNGNVKPITGVLQHAPFPFQTLTGASGAMAYADGLFLTSGTPARKSVWTNSRTNRTLTHVVVHLLPGLYGPRSVPGLPDIDPATGIPFNGEAWPATLPDRVSLQGTSALDTILDARKQVSPNPILHVNDPAFSSNWITSHLESFVDGITFRHARSDHLTPGSGAGIYFSARGIQQPVPIYGYVTNCIFSDNTVGIGLDSYASATDTVGMRPALLNNTFAWNGVGLYAGGVTPTLETGVISVHNPMVANCIFDSGSPSGYVPGVAGFQGVAAQMKQIKSLGTPVYLTNPGNAAAGLDFNAWESTFVNLTTSVDANWPWPAQSHTVTWLGPRVDLLPYTRGGPGAARSGSLYVNDMLRNSGFGGTGVDYSPHDFRLAPFVTPSSTPPGLLAPPVPNPLVDQGVDDTLTGPLVSAFPITGANGRVLADRPGLPWGKDDTRMDGWWCDAEGYGNERVFAYPGSTFTPGMVLPDIQLRSRIDLGADELGTLVMAGMLDGTRLFADGAPNATFSLHIRVLFFDLVGTGTHPRPRFNTRGGYFDPATDSPASYTWHAHVQVASDHVSPTNNYTRMGSYPLQSMRWVMHTVYPTYCPEHERNLDADFSGHMIPDPQGYWGFLLRSSPPFGPIDCYGSDSWYATANPPVMTLDNPALFNNLGAVQPHRKPDGNPGLFGLVWTFPYDKCVNPPGTYSLAGGTRLVGASAQFGPYTPCTGGATYTVGPWGYGSTATGCPDVLPLPAGSANAGRGIRYNCEVAGSAGTPSNLQTFLVVLNTAPEQAASGTRTTLIAPRAPTLEELLSRIRASGRSR